MNRNPEPAVLVLADGTRYTGSAYGARGERLGQMVFVTNMGAYQETLTDPVHAGQIVVQTLPHIGNTGINSEDSRSDRAQVAGYVVREPSRIVSNWRAETDLESFLIDQGVVGISGIDTRALTRRIRDAGASSLYGGIFSGAQAQLDAAEQLRRVIETTSTAGTDTEKDNN